MGEEERRSEEAIDLEQRAEKRKGMMEEEEAMVTEGNKAREIFLESRDDNATRPESRRPL